MFKLVISDDEGKTTVVPLVRDEISIGRQEGNTIRLTERNVSRRHAVLRRDAGGFAIEDLGSHNGVRINGRRIEGQAPLAAEDQVAIGDYVVTLHEEVAAGTAQAEADAPLVPPRLVMLTEPAPGAEFALTGDGQRIGRAEELDIWINHRSISREHAVVRVDGGVIRVVDLQSANGLRLNGKDTADAVLSAGDVIELGQVRFRFVGAGETFVFDLAEVAPVPAPERGASRLPLLLALLVLGGAIAFGVAYLSKEAPASTRPPEPLAPVGAERSADDEAAAAAARCEAARAEGRPEDALVAAVAALELNPANAEAMACRAALGEAAEARARCLSVAEASREDPTLIDQAYFSCADLADPGPEVLATRRAYAEAHLARGAEARAAGDRETAAYEANLALTVEGLDASLRARAEALLAPPAPSPGPGMRRLVAAPPGAGAAPADARRSADAASTAAASMGTAATGTAAMDTASRDTAPSSPSPAATASMSAPGAMAAVPTTTSADPRQIARECQYDSRCIVHNLSGRAHSARALSLLIETHRQLGQTRAMRREMRSFLRRYPNDARADGYRQQLE